MNKHNLLQLNSSQCWPMNCQKAMTLPLKEEASHLDPKVKVT
jgi:hypothetical protein